jgi:hypothetical protein
MKPTRILAVTVVVATLTGATASALVVDLGLNTAYTFSGLPGGGGTPWLTATICDAGVNTVQLTLKAPNLAASEFVSKWLFNLNPSLDPDDLIIAQSATVGSFASPTITPTQGVNYPNNQQNQLGAGGGLLFDFGFGFESSGATGGAQRFTDGDEVTFTITGINGLTVNDFLYTTAKGDFGPFTSAAHIQGIGQDGNFSAWVGDGVPVPEPTTVIAGCLLLGILALRERSRLSQAFARIAA